ncbi:ParB/Srx family N-terminal domain-containing protein [Alistipes sp.]|uniref:ParB/Srx family N-terminal domain-containing protein n=1 Tax=Alistipes sp. TaxID=1872444 RepID=UPI003AF15AEF
MKKMMITSDNDARQFAFVKGNRAINAKTVKAKEESIKEYGQLSPITVVKGEDVFLMDRHLVDLAGNDIPDNQTENYYAVLDGQHRLVAYMNMKMNLDDLVICEPLNVEMSIAALIAEMNICTTSWKGTDYMAAPAMTLGVENKVFEFAMHLRSKGCPLATISLWCTGANSLKPKDLVACVKSKELPKSFVEAGWYERSVRWYEAAQGKFTDAFLAKKYLITHLSKKFSHAADPTAFTVQMVEQINRLSAEQVKEIMNPRKEEGQSREQATFDMLEKYLG